MSQLGLDSLRNFVVDEIKIMTLDCAQTFFKQDDKNGSREPLANKNFQVHRVGVELENSPHSEKSHKVSMSRLSYKCGMAKLSHSKSDSRGAKKLPLCLVCSSPE